MFDKEFGIVANAFEKTWEHVYDEVKERDGEQISAPSLYFHKANPGWNYFDVLLLLWYGWSLVSVNWALSFSEGLFYAQKNLLLLLYLSPDESTRTIAAPLYRDGPHRLYTLGSRATD